MTDAGDRVQAALDGCANFLRENELSLSKHQAYLIRWVREFVRGVYN